MDNYSFGCAKAAHTITDGCRSFKAVMVSLQHFLENPTVFSHAKVLHAIANQANGPTNGIMTAAATKWEREVDDESWRASPKFAQRLGSPTRKALFPQVTQCFSCLRRDGSSRRQLTPSNSEANATGLYIGFLIFPAASKLDLVEK